MASTETTPDSSKVHRHLGTGHGNSPVELLQANVVDADDVGGGHLGHPQVRIGVQAEGLGELVDEGTGSGLGRDGGRVGNGDDAAGRRGEEGHGARRGGSRDGHRCTGGGGQGLNAFVDRSRTSRAGGVTDGRGEGGQDANAHPPEESPRRSRPLRGDWNGHVDGGE